MNTPDFLFCLGLQDGNEFILSTQYPPCLLPVQTIASPDTDDIIPLANSGLGVHPQLRKRIKDQARRFGNAYLDHARAALTQGTN